MITTTKQDIEAPQTRRELPLGWRAATLMRSRWIREERSAVQSAAVTPTSPPRPVRAAR